MLLAVRVMEGVGQVDTPVPGGSDFGQPAEGDAEVRHDERTDGLSVPPPKSSLKAFGIAASFLARCGSE